MLVDAVALYLSRLGLPGNLPPTAETLVRLHHRHLDEVPYENLAIMLGRPDSTDPGQTLERIAGGGNAGYCFHHNGAFEIVLRALGFNVERRSGHVQGSETPQLNHLVLLVTLDGRRWWPDLGLGDALRDPVEVLAGKIRQGPFTYEITTAGDEGWTFRHDPAAGSFAALDVHARRPADAEVAEAHRMLSTPPDGRFSRVLVVQRRDDTGTSVLRGIRHRRIGDGAFARDLTSYADWRAGLKTLGVSLAGATGDELRSLHTRMLTDHEKWVAGGGLRHGPPQAAVVTAAVWLHQRGDRILAVRPHGNDVFYLPGGLPEPGESYAQAAAREVREETGMTVDVATLHETVRIEDDAHGRPGVRVRLVCFEGPATGNPVAGDDEIAEVAWLPPSQWHQFAPAVRKALAARPG